jgi:hypothetical protein
MRKTSCIVAVLALLSACAEYQFTVNERVVYSPAPLFTDYTIEDASLEKCIKQTVQDQSITAAAQLTELNCSHAGVTALKGIEAFSHIERLKLSNNSITNIGALASMMALKVLYLDGNQVRSLLPLRSQAELSFLNVQDNTALVCAELTYFAAMPDLSLERPAHCAG